MEQVWWSSLQEFKEKAAEVKQLLGNKNVKIKLDRTKADIRKMKQQLETDNDISVGRASLDKEIEKELSAFAKRIEKEYVAQLKKALSDQRALFANVIAQDRVIADEVLQKTREDNDANIKRQQETIDSLNDQARALVEELENQCSKLKHVAMKFKVFKLEELYYDLQKYDHRASLGEFAIEGRSVKFHKFIRALRYHGYILDAEVYYLNPAPGSKPSTDLVRIVGQEDIKQMVCAHAEHGTKICLLYLVTRYEDQHPDDVMIDSSESDDEADGTSNANIPENTTASIRQSGDGWQLPRDGDNP